MRNVSVHAVVACWNYLLIVTTIRQRQWYCTVAISRDRKTTTPYVMALFVWQLEWENSLQHSPDCNWWRGGWLPSPNNPAADWARRASIGLWPSVLGHLNLGPRPFQAGISWINMIKSLSSKIRLIIRINWISSIKPITRKLLWLLFLMCKVW